MQHYTVYAWSKCPFCAKAKALLLEKGFEFQYIVLDHAPNLLSNYKSIYNMKTVPIIVYKDEDLQIEETIGGYTDLVEYFSKEVEKDSRDDD